MIRDPLTILLLLALLGAVIAIYYTSSDMNRDLGGFDTFQHGLMEGRR